MRRIHLISLCALIGIVGAGRADDPVYQGKSARVWAKELGNLSTCAEAARKLADGGCDALPVILRALEEVDGLVGRNACEGLLRHLGAEAVHPLVECLCMGKKDERQRAIIALGILGPTAEPAVPALIDMFEDDDKAIRDAALLSLGEIGPVPRWKVVPLLRDAFQRKDDKFSRPETLAVLARLGAREDSTLMPLFLRALSDDDSKVGAEAYAALVLHGLKANPKKEAIAPAPKEFALPPLFGAGHSNLADVIASDIEDEDGWIARFAQRTLKPTGYVRPRMIAKLLVSVNDPDERIRRLSVVLLGVLRADSPGVRKSLATRLGDVKTSNAAALVLANMGADGLRMLIVTPVKRSEELLMTDVAAWALQERSEASLPVLLAALKERDEAVRIRGAQILGEMPSSAKVVVPALIAALKDRASSDAVRSALVEALGKFAAADERVLSVLIGALSDPATRGVGAVACRKLGPRAVAAAPALFQALRHPSETSDYWEVCRALQALGAAAVPVVAPGLRDGDAKVREQSAKILSEIGAPATPALLEALRSPTPEVRRGAATALGELKYAKAVDARKDAIAGLTKALGDRSESVRGAVVESLARFGKEQVTSLTSALKDKSPEVRSKAAGCIGGLGSDASAAVDPLTDVLEDASEAVRLAGAAAIGKIGTATPRSSIAVARLYRREGNVDIRRAVIEAIGETRAEPMTAVPLLIEALADGDANVVRSAIKSLQAFGPDADLRRGRMRILGGPASVPELKKLMHGEGYREECARALAVIGDRSPLVVRLVCREVKSSGQLDRDVVPALAALGPSARSTYPDLLARLARSPKDAGPFDEFPFAPQKEELGELLARIGPGTKKDQDRLLELLKNPEEPIRTGAAFALDGLGPEHADMVPGLRAFLADGNSGGMSDHQVRVKVIKALGNIGPAARAAVPDLVRILRGEQPFTTHFAAAYAITQLGAAKEGGDLVVKVLRDATAEDNGHAFESHRGNSILIIGASDNPVIRVYAAGALVKLGEMKAKEAVPLFIAGLGLEEAHARAFSAGELGALGPEAKRAVPALTAALRDRDAGVRQRAGAALLKVADPPAWDDILRRLGQPAPSKSVTGASVPGFRD